MAKKAKAERLPPYVSYSTWTKLMNGLVNFLPDVIDSSVYSQLRFSGSDTKKLRTALRYLNLIDETGVPSGRLHELVRAYRGEGESEAIVLLQIMREAYPFLSDDSLNLRTATWKQLTDRFSTIGATANLQRQCVSFFLHMAAEAGMEISPHLSSRSKSGLGRPSVVRKTRRKQRQKTQQRELGEETGEFPSVRRSRSEAIWALDINPTVAGILRLLPREGEKWDRDRKKRFKIALESVLDAVYPDEDGR
jgi:hypothetical protein